MNFITQLLADSHEKNKLQLEVRKKLRLEQAFFLEHDKDFSKRISELQSMYQIKGLDPETDMLVGDKEFFDGKKQRFFEVVESRFLDSYFGNDTEKKNQFYAQILNILYDFGLEMCFYDYVEYWVLYNRKPDWEVTYSIDSLARLLQKESMIPGYPLTTGEKQFLAERKRYKLGIGETKGRITNAEYLEFLKLLKQSKNNIRSSRLYKQKEIVQKRGGFDEYVDADGKAIREKVTYKKLAMEIESSDDPNDLIRASNNLKKANQRLNVRKKLLKSKIK